MKNMRLIIGLLVVIAQAVLAAEALPTADQILAKNVEALGGKAALQKVTSRVIKGKMTSPMLSGEAVWEAAAKAPSKRTTTLTIPGMGVMREGYNGQMSWAQSAQADVKEKTGEELARAQRDAEFYPELNVKALYPQITVKGKETIGAQEVYVLEGKPPTGEPERFYFDARSGLLLRREMEVKADSGPVLVRLEFEDYRELEGVKYPFVLKMPKPEMVQFVLKISEIKINPPLADAIFNKPAAQ